MSRKGTSIKGITTVLLANLMLLSIYTNAQNIDTIKQRYVKHYRQKFGIDESKGNLVVDINRNYKNAVKAVAADNSLSDKDKRKKIDLLITEKNKQLNKILTSAQLSEILPSTEQKKLTTSFNQDSVVKKRQVQYLSRKLSVSPSLANKVYTVQEEYNTSVKMLTSNSQISAQQKSSQFKNLVAIRNSQLAAFLSPAQLDVVIPGRKNFEPDQKSAFSDLKRFKETASIQDSFEYKRNLVMADKSLSRQKKLEQIGELMSQRNKAIVKALGQKMDITLKDTTNRKMTF